MNITLVRTYIVLQGVIAVEQKKPHFKEIIMEVTASNLVQMTDAIQKYECNIQTIFIKNHNSVNTAEVQIVVSPDGHNWAEETSFQKVLPQETIFLIQGIYAKEVALNFRTLSGTAKLTIWFQLSECDECSQEHCHDGHHPEKKDHCHPENNTKVDKPRKIVIW